MKPLSRLESLIAEIIERPAWALSSHRLHPLELTTALTKAMERRAVRLADRVLAPDDYEVRIHPTDLAAFGDAVVVLNQQLGDYLERTIVERDISANRPPTVHLEGDATVRRGRCDVRAAFTPAAGTIRGDCGEGTPAFKRSVRGPARRSLKDPMLRPASGQPSRPAGHDAALEVLDADGRLIRRVALARLPLMIGRRSDVDLPLIDGKVSREHASIDRNANGKYIITDLQSLNGTLVNGEQIQSARALRDGDLLEIGHFRLCLRLNGSL